MRFDGRELKLGNLKPRGELGRSMARAARNWDKPRTPKIREQEEHLEALLEARKAAAQKQAVGHWGLGKI